jgi:hypothetical protein
MKVKAVRKAWLRGCTGVSGGVGGEKAKRRAEGCERSERRKYFFLIA